MIYHVVQQQQWNTALAQGYYEAPSLQLEGFIHCSQQSQIEGVLQRYYKGQMGLLLLHIEETLLDATLKYELAPSVNEEFPHVFGRININAVTKAVPIQ